MIDASYVLPLLRQTAALARSRSSLYYKSTPLCETDLSLMRVIDKAGTDHPFAGARMLREMLRQAGFSTIGRRKVERLKRVLSIAALHRKKQSTKRNPQHQIYPHLLRGSTIERPNQVRCGDFTYIPMRHAFLYLFAIFDWATRRVIAWRPSNSMTS